MDWCILAVNVLHVIIRETHIISISLVNKLCGYLRGSRMDLIDFDRNESSFRFCYSNELITLTWLVRLFQVLCQGKYTSI